MSSVSKLAKGRNHHVLALYCDASGAVVKRLMDRYGFFAADRLPASLDEVIEARQKPRFKRFLEESMESGVAVCKDMPLLKDGDTWQFLLIGVSLEQVVLLIGVQSPEHLLVVIDDFMNIFREQDEMLRECRVESARQSEGNGFEHKDVLEEYMKINNEMAQTQRELSKANAMLKAQEQRFRQLVDINHEAQVVLAGNRRVLFLNPAAREVFGVSGDDVEAVAEALPDTLAGDCEYEVDGALRHYDVLSNEVVWEGDTVTLVTLRDVTARREAEAQRLETSRFEGVLEMAGSAAHEFSQPLQSLMMDIEFIKGQVAGGDEDVDEAVEGVISSGTRLARLVKKVQTITRYSTADYSETQKIIDLDKASADEG